jgi:hypothetical protein
MEEGPPPSPARRCIPELLPLPPDTGASFVTAGYRSFFRRCWIPKLSPLQRRPRHLIHDNSYNRRSQWRRGCGASRSRCTTWRKTDGAGEQSKGGREQFNVD